MQTWKSSALLLARSALFPARAITIFGLACLWSSLTQFFARTNDSWQAKQEVEGESVHENNNKTMWLKAGDNTGLLRHRTSLLIQCLTPTSISLKRTERESGLCHIAVEKLCRQVLYLFMTSSTTVLYSSYGKLCLNVWKLSWLHSAEQKALRDQDQNWTWKIVFMLPGVFLDRQLLYYYYYKRTCTHSFLNDLQYVLRWYHCVVEQWLIS